MTASSVAETTIKAPMTQKQIAEMAGVSPQLVGFALRGQGRMRDEVRERILQVARENGYNPHLNSAARDMVLRRHGKQTRTGILAVLFEATFNSQPLIAVPYFAPFFTGMEQEARHQGVELSLCPLRLEEMPRMISESKVDGVIGLSTRPEVTRQINELGITVVNVNSDVEGHPSLVVDHEAAMEMAVQYLAQLGHRNIAYLGTGGNLDDPSRPAYWRYRTYRTQVAQLQPENPDLLCSTTLCVPTMEEGATGMAQLLERFGVTPNGRNRLPFTAVVCYNDLIAMGATRELQRSGWRVPQDVSIVGLDDTAREYAFAPALTSVAFPREQMGRRAVQLLCEQRTADQSHPLREVFPVELVKRDSTSQAT